MSTPSPAPSAGSPPPGGPPPDESIRALLSISRSLALVFAILAGLLFLLFLAFTVLDVVFGRGAGDLVTAVYCLASAAVNFVLWREIPRLELLAAARQYAALREHLLIWAVLGVIFFVVVGVLLLIAWVRAELLATSPAPMPPPGTT
jgi:hypothetical protein